MSMKIDEQLSHSVEIRILKAATAVKAIATRLHQEQHQHQQRHRHRHRHGKIHQ